MSRNEKLKANLNRLLVGGESQHHRCANILNNASSSWPIDLKTCLSSNLYLTSSGSLAWRGIRVGSCRTSSSSSRSAWVSIHNTLLTSGAPLWRRCTWVSRWSPYWSGSCSRGLWGTWPARWRTSQRWLQHGSWTGGHVVLCGCHAKAFLYDT